MEQLLLHLLGDYIIQTDDMAATKKAPGFRGFAYCFLHCLTYALPFLLIATPTQVIWIFTAHYPIDRFWFIQWFMRNTGKKAFLLPPFAPWSIILTDNIFHLILNYLIIRFL